MWKIGLGNGLGKIHSEFNEAPKIEYQPVAGTVLIFPSWLYHGVQPNLDDVSRVCISFNIGTRPVTSEVGNRKPEM